MTTEYYCYRTCNNKLYYGQRFCNKCGESLAHFWNRLVREEETEEFLKRKVSSSFKYGRTSNNNYYGV